MKKLLLILLSVFVVQYTYSQQHLYSRSTAQTWSTTDGGADCSCTPTSVDTVTISHNWANPTYYPLTNPVNIAYGTYIVALATDNPAKVIVKSGGVAYQTGTVPTGMILEVQSGGIWGYNGSTIFHGTDANSISSLTNDGSIVLNGSFDNNMALVSTGEFCRNGSWLNDITEGATLNGVGDANMDPYFTTSNYGTNCYTPAPLPVELMYFRAVRVDNDIKYYWATASEINNHYFEVMVSNDGFTWESAVVIPGFGNSTEKKTYSVQSMMSNYNYAKLKQVDYDGTTDFSRIISLGQVKTPISIMNNQIFVNSDVTETISIFDTRGRTLMSSIVPPGPQIIQINFKGVLFVRVGNQTKKIIR